MSHDPDTIAQRCAAMLAHARFGEARRALIDGYLAVYSHEPVLNKLLVDGARHVIITFVMCLDAAKRVDDPDTWLTLSRLQDFVARHQVGSPGLVEAIVTRMIDRGLLTSTPAPTDRRKRILAPSAAMLAHDLDLIAAQAAPCAILEPKPALDLALTRDRAMQHAIRVGSVKAFGEAMALLGAHPEMMLFVARDSGYLVLLSMLASAQDSPGGSTSAVAYRDIADRFGVSRTHVRQLVADAEQMGLVRVLDSGGPKVEIQPKLWACVDRWLAATWELFDRLAVEAYDALKGAER